MATLEVLAESFEERGTASVWLTLLEACRAASNQVHVREKRLFGPSSTTSHTWYLVDLMTMLCTCPALARCWHQLLVARLRTEVMTATAYNTRVAQYLKAREGTSTACAFLKSSDLCLCGYNTLTMARLFGFPMCIHFASRKPATFTGSFADFAIASVGSPHVALSSITVAGSVATAEANRVQLSNPLRAWVSQTRALIKTVTDSPETFAAHLDDLQAGVQHLSDTVLTISGKAPTPLMPVSSDAGDLLSRSRLTRTLYGHFAYTRGGNGKRPRTEVRPPPEAGALTQLQATSKPVGRPPKKPKTKR
jgi:hypothetical protein